MSVGEVCQRHVVTIGPDESVRAAAKKMDAEGVGSVVVVDAELRPVGILTDRDIAMRVLRRQRNADETCVSEVMTDDVMTLRESASLRTGLGRLRSDGVRRAPVLDSGGHLVGIFAVEDALAYIARDVSAASQVAGAQRALSTA